MLYGLIAIGVFLPFFMTSLGALMSAGVSKFFSSFEDEICGFCGGIMVSASIFSLILPSIEASNGGAWITALGIGVGGGFVAFIEWLYIKINKKELVGGKDSAFLAIAIHNLPEGMIVGIAFCATLSGGSLSEAMGLSIAIAIQNVPEGAIASLVALGKNSSKKRAVLYGCLSGAIEPLGAIFALLFVGLSKALLPFCLSFSAGAMMFVTICSLVPKKRLKSGAGFFLLGFVLMMVLDVLL